MLKQLTFGTCLFLAGCAPLVVNQPSHHANDKPTKEIDLAAYAEPFGFAPKQPDLEKILVSLPDELAADMSASHKLTYIRDFGSDPLNPLFDRIHKYATFYIDNPFYRYRPSSSFYLKILSSSRYGYVAVIHLMKPYSLGVPPRASNTFFLAPKDAKWVDVTNDVLPKQVPRDWYFQPLRSTDTIETGPYEKSSSDSWRGEKRIYDLVWAGNFFRLKNSPSSKFTYDP